MGRRSAAHRSLSVMAALAAVIALSSAAPAAGELGFADIAGRRRDEVPDAAPCCVTGVVTLVSAWTGRSGVIASPEDLNGYGVWFSGEVNAKVVAELEGAGNLAVGQLVEVRGISSRLGFAPGIKADSLKVLHQAQTLPPPPAYRLRDFDHGALDNRRAALTGVLMEALSDETVQPPDSPVYTRLRLNTADGVFVARVRGEPECWRGKVDANLLMCGVAMSVFNIRGEFIGVQLEVAGVDGVSVLEGPQPFEAVPTVSLDTLLPYSPGRFDAHRKRVRGVVTCQRDGGATCYLQSDEGAMCVRVDKGGASTGDEVEAVGFPMLEDGVGVLVNSEVRVAGRGVLPRPERVGWAELDGYPVDSAGAFKDFNSRLVRMTGRLVAMDEASLALDVEGVKVYVNLSSPLPGDIAECAESGPTLAVTGILLIRQEQGLPRGRVPRIEERRVYAVGPDGVALVKDAAWRRYRRKRMMTHASGVVFCLAVAVALILFFRYVRMRTNYRRLKVLNDERKRIAGDLHDSIEQNLVAVKMLLKTAVSLSPDIPEDARKAVLTAQEILLAAKSEIRETVFNLRSDDLFSRRPEEVIKTFCRRMASHGVVKVRTVLRGLPDSLPGAMFSDMLFVVQEAVTNAVKHGGAKSIVLVSDPLEARAPLGRAKGGFCLRILNDGEPFDPATALGPESGHFGIAGMRERARRSGFNLTICRERGHVCVRLEVPS